MDCLFCSIIKGDIPSTKVFEDEKCYAFLDINPQAPVHCLVIPKTHLSSLNDVDDENSEIIAHIMSIIPRIAIALGLENGYRVVTNIGEDGCQYVKHLHFHILGGEKLSENMA